MDKEKLLKVAGDLRSLADSVQALVSESVQEKAEPGIGLEKVRGVLAEKSRAGFTVQVREILKSHGADKLSGIDPKEYPAILAEAEVLS